MADTENTGGEETAASSEADDALSAPAPSKKTTSKKKVVARKAAKKTTKKTTKKVAAKKVAAKATPAPAATAALPPAAPSQPVWDDDATEGGLLDSAVHVGPVLLLIILMLVLGLDETPSMTSGALDLPGLSVEEQSVAGASWSSLTSSDSTAGAIAQTSDSNLWPANSLDGGWGALGQDDPGAFYWGPAIVDEAPPAPSSD